MAPSSGLAFIFKPEDRVAEEFNNRKRCCRTKFGITYFKLIGLVRVNRMVRDDRKGNESADLGCIFRRLRVRPNAVELELPRSGEKSRQHLCDATAGTKTTRRRLRSTLQHDHGQQDCSPRGV